MSPLVFLLLVASGTLAEVTECTDGSTPTMAAPTQATAWGAKASPDHPKIVPWLLSAEDFDSEASPARPVKTVCMMKVNCIDSSAITSEELQTDEELQRDEEFQDVPTTPKDAETTTPSSGTTKAKRPPLPCTIEIQVVRTYRGQCVRLGEDYGGCRAGPWVSPMVRPCHPPPQD